MPGPAVPSRWLPVLLVASAVLGVASAVGAQVDPGGQPAPTAWASSCVPPGRSDLFVYGHGWAAGPVNLEVRNGDAVVGSASTTAADRQARGAVFQGRIPLAPEGAQRLELTATQGQRRDTHAITVAGACRSSVAATLESTTCAPAGRRVNVTARVSGATSSFSSVAQYGDLYGPAEAVDRTQPPRSNGSYDVTFGIPSVPDRVVPVTVELRRADGGFEYATTTVGLPPACPDAPTTTTTGPAPAAPGTTQPPGAGTTLTTAPGAAPGTSVAPAPGQPRLPAARSVGSLALSPTIGRPGEATTVVGRGFAPSATVTLRWRPGIGQWTVRAGGDGSFRSQVLVLPKDVEGPRLLEVAEGGVAPASYLVVPASDQPAFGGIFVRG